MNKALARWQQAKYNELIKYMRENKIKKVVEHVKIMSRDIKFNGRQRKNIRDYYRCTKKLISTLQEAILHSELKWRLIKLDPKIIDVDALCGFCEYSIYKVNPINEHMCSICPIANICGQHIKDPDLALAILEDLKQWEDKINE